MPTPKRRIEKRCPACQCPLLVLLDADGKPIIEDGDAKAVCEDRDCWRAIKGAIIYVSPAEARNRFQAEP